MMSYIRFGEPRKLSRGTANVYAYHHIEEGKIHILSITETAEPDYTTGIFIEPEDLLELIDHILDQSGIELTEDEIRCIKDRLFIPPDEETAEVEGTLHDMA